MSTTPTLSRGMTARIGKGRTAIQWEVLAINGDQASLSKLGGDGYVNKTVRQDELNRIEPQLLEVTLGEVLAIKAELARWNEALTTGLRGGFHPERVQKASTQILEHTSQYAKAVHAYLHGVRKHYPHLKEA